MLVDGGNICWHRDGIDRYLFHVEKFLAILAVLVNVTGGQPAWRTELLTLQFANLVTNLQNIYIQDSQVMIIADYYNSVAGGTWNIPLKILCLISIGL